MESNATTGAAGAAGAGNGEGNSDLAQAFDKAIGEAKKTLALTTEKGADLYALKQSVR